MTENVEPPQAAPPEAQPSPPKPKRRRLRFWLRATFLICLTPIIFAAAVAVMVIERDVRAPSWIVERIETRAAALMAGGDLRFGAISLRIGSDLHPTVRLRDIQLTDVNGAVISRIPVVEGVMSPRGLIFQQEVLMQDIRLIGAQVNLRRARDGSVAVAFGSGAPKAGEAGSLPQLLDQLDVMLERPPLEALETVRAEGLVVNFDDARAARSWVVDGGSVALDLRNGQTVLNGDFALLSGRSGVTTVALSYTSPRGSRSAQLGLNISDAIASDIAAQSPGLSWLRDIEAPLTGSLRTSLDAEGALGPLNATLEIGQGVLQPNAATEPVQFNAAKAYLTYDPVRDRISFSEIALETDWGQLRATGDAYLREFANGLPRALLAQFQFADLAVNPAGLYDAPLTIDRATVDLRLRFAPFAVDVGQLVVTDGPTRLSAHGDVTATADGWRFAMDGAVDQIDPEKLIRFWPKNIKTGTRAWIASHVSEGRFIDAHAGVRIAPNERIQFAAGFGFEDMSIQIMRALPTVINAAGTASVIDGGFTVSLDQGVASAPQGGQMQLAGSRFAIPDLAAKPPLANIDLRTQSTVTAVLSVLNQPPFLFLDKAKLPVTIADGRASVRGRIDMPLMPVIPPDDVGFAFTADARSVRSSVLVPGRQVSSAQLEIDADRNGLSVQGPVRVGDVPMRVAWSRQFTAGQAGQSQLQAEVELSSRFLNAFNIALPPGSVAGAADADLTIDLQEGKPPRFALTSDLQGLRVDVPPLGWSKPPNGRGALEVEGTFGVVPTVSKLLVTGDGLRAEGRIDLAAQGRLDTVQFSRLQVGDWLDAPITLRGRGAGQPLGVEINGGRVDLRRARFAGGGGGDGGPVQISLDRLQITEGIALTGFRGDFSTSGGFSGQFQAQLNGGAAVRGTVAPRNGRSAVRLLSDDAGGVVRAAGLMRNAVGGSLDLTLLPAGGAGTFDGALAVRGIRVRDAPAMAALLDAISVVGLLQQLDGQGLAFDEVDARFRLNPQQVILTEASAVGPGLGISLDGIYTLANKQLDLQGVVSPFYLVNSIGSILTRRGEGLIGFNFNIGGRSDAPTVSVNPLSAFTPGMFREIFRRPPPEVTQ